MRASRDRGERLALSAVEASETETKERMCTPCRSSLNELHAANEAAMEEQESWAGT